MDPDGGRKEILRKQRLNISGSEWNWRDGRFKPKPNEVPFKPKCQHIKTCVYRLKIEGCGTFCNYIAETGHSRGCSPDKCDKYKPKKRGAKDG